MPAAGGTPVRLRTDHDYDFDPSWSPDGHNIVFVSEKEARQGPRELWISGTTPGSAAERLIRYPDRNLNGCEWSPDGGQIAFVAYSFPPWLSDILLVSTEGEEPTLWSEGGSSDRNPDWSPDGEKIAFSSDRSGNWDVWVRPAGGGEAVQLTDEPGWDGQPTWSPDGTQIAFTSDRGGSIHVWIMSAAGEDPQPVTSGPYGDGDPAWSPDGDRICFERWGGNRSDIWVVHLE
ncbi:MAG: hypothetical protein GF355_07500 [Candidatus Eisenbacteria bacterium]|nr:hypothetical protein [Candidatus Eisenbacteria bacterium]